MGNSTVAPHLSPAMSSLPAGKKPFYRTFWVQESFAMVLAIAVGFFSPSRAVAMKPLGDAFIRLISMSAPTAPVTPGSICPASELALAVKANCGVLDLPLPQVGALAPCMGGWSKGSLAYLVLPVSLPD